MQSSGSTRQPLEVESTGTDTTRLVRRVQPLRDFELFGTDDESDQVRLSTMMADSSNSSIGFRRNGENTSDPFFDCAAYDDFPIFPSTDISNLYSTSASTDTTNLCTDFRSPPVDSSPFDFDLDFDADPSPAALPDLIPDSPSPPGSTTTALPSLFPSLPSSMTSLEQVRKTFLSIDLSAYPSQISPINNSLIYNSDLTSSASPSATVSPKDVSPNLPLFHDFDSNVDSTFPALFSPISTISSSLSSAHASHVRNKKSVSRSHLSIPGNSMTFGTEDEDEDEEDEDEYDDEASDRVAPLLHDHYRGLTENNAEEETEMLPPSLDLPRYAAFGVDSKRSHEEVDEDDSGYKRARSEFSDAEEGSEAALAESPLYSPDSVNDTTFSFYSPSTYISERRSSTSSSIKKKPRRRATLQPNKIRRRAPTTTSTAANANRGGAKLRCDFMVPASEDGSFGSIVDHGVVKEVKEGEMKRCGVSFRRETDLSRHKENIHGTSFLLSDPLPVGLLD